MPEVSPSLTKGLQQCRQRGGGCPSGIRSFAPQLGHCAWYNRASSWCRGSSPTTPYIARPRIFVTVVSGSPAVSWWVIGPR
jgi:hypothetical protein